MSMSTAEERVEEELDRRILATRPSPDADEEVHRQQHHLPEHVEEKEVERHEHADHPGDEEQEEHVVGLDVLRDRPARGAGEHREERGQEHQRHADAVDAEQVLDAEGRNPRLLHHGLHARLADRELRGPRGTEAEGGEETGPRHPERQHEGDRGGRERDPADRLLARLGNDRQRQQGRDEGRQEDDQREWPQGGLRQGVGRHVGGSGRCWRRRVRERGGGGGGGASPRRRFSLRARCGAGIRRRQRRRPCRGR